MIQDTIFNIVNITYLYLKSRYNIKILDKNL